MEKLALFISMASFVLFIYIAGISAIIWVAEQFDKDDRGF